MKSLRITVYLFCGLGLWLSLIASAITLFNLRFRSALIGGGLLCGIVLIITMLLYRDQVLNSKKLLHGYHYTSGRYQSMIKRDLEDLAIDDAIKFMDINEENTCESKREVEAITRFHECNCLSPNCPTKGDDRDPALLSIKLLKEMIYEFSYVNMTTTTIFLIGLMLKKESNLLGAWEIAQKAETSHLTFSETYLLYCYKKKLKNIFLNASVNCRDNSVFSSDFVLGITASNLISFYIN